MNRPKNHAHAVVSNNVVCVFFSPDGFAFRVFLLTDNKFDDLDYPLDMNTQRYDASITADTDLTRNIEGKPAWFPHGLENVLPFSSQGILNRLEK